MITISTMFDIVLMVWVFKVTTYHIHYVWHCFDGMGIQGDNIPHPLRLAFWWYGYSRWQHTISTTFGILMVWVFKVTTYHIHYVWHFDGMGIQGDNIPYPLCLTLYWWYGYSRWQHTISTTFGILMVWVFKVTTYHIHYVWHFDGMGIQGDNIPYPLCLTLFWWYGYSRWQHTISTMFDIVLMEWVFKVTTYHIHYVWHCFDGMGIQGDNIPYPLRLTFWWYGYSRWQHTISTMFDILMVWVFKLTTYHIHDVWHCFDGMGIQGDNLPYPLCLTFWWYGYSSWQHTISTMFDIVLMVWVFKVTTYHIHYVWHFDGMGIQGDNIPYPLCLTLFWWYRYSRWQHTISTMFDIVLMVWVFKVTTYHIHYVWHCFDGMGIQGDNIAYPLRLTFWWYGYSTWQHTISTMFDIVLMVWVFNVTTYHIHYVWHFDGMGIQGDNIPYPLCLTLFWWYGYSRWQHTISTMFDIVLMVWVFKLTTYHIHYVWHCFDGMGIQGDNIPYPLFDIVLMVWVFKVTTYHIHYVWHCFDGMGIQGDNISYPLCLTLFWWYGFSRWQHTISTMFDIVLMEWVFKVTTYHIH